MVLSCNYIYGFYNEKEKFIAILKKGVVVLENHTLHGMISPVLDISESVSWGWCWHDPAYLCQALGKTLIIVRKRSARQGN